MMKVVTDNNLDEEVAEMVVECGAEETPQLTETTLPPASHLIDSETDKNVTGACVVCPGLVLCGAGACAAALRSVRPACVVSAAPELPAAPLGAARCLRLPLLDSPDADIYQYFDPVADLINEVKSTGSTTIVHCVAGVSRSASLCLAYLLKWEKMTLRDAYHHLKQCRPQIRPNTGFFKQLIKYEQQLFGETSVKMVYCDVIDKDIPDVYEPDYQAMAWFRKRYGHIQRY